MTGLHNTDLTTSQKIEFSVKALANPGAVKSQNHRGRSGTVRTNNYRPVYYVTE